MAHLKPMEILARAKEFLQGADHAIKDDWWNVCTICSYAALFWAARAALVYEGLDQPTWKHSDLRSKFKEELIKNRGRYPSNFNTWLGDAFLLRNNAQYHFAPPKAKKVRRMVYHTKEFIQKVEEVISK